MKKINVLSSSKAQEFLGDKYQRWFKYAVISGNIFCRESGDVFWTYSDLGYTQGHSPDGIGVICSCGNDKFHLNYGCYEIEATCSKCKKHEIVYDG